MLNLDAIGAWPPKHDSHVEMDGAWALYEAWLRLHEGDIEIAVVTGSGRSSTGDPALIYPMEMDSPLRGRSDVELIIRPFGFRESAHFWGLRSNPDAAFRLHALVGGTPAYRDFGGHPPIDGDIDRWVVGNVLDPASPLFREGRVVIAEDPALAEQSLYWGVLGAIADGARHRSEIAEALGRPPTSLAHALAVVVDAGWVLAESDPLKDRGTTFHITEPIVRLHRLVIEPHEARLTLRRDPDAVWQDVLPLVRTQIYGVHLEHLAKEWIMAHAAPETLGGTPTNVGSSLLTNGKRGERRKLDLVVTEQTPRGGTRVLAIGEVKAGVEPVGLDQLVRLEASERSLRDAVVQPLKKLLLARAGFTVELIRAARNRPDVELIDLQRLYVGE